MGMVDGVRVLVVDDDHDSRSIAAELIRRAGYSVAEAADGAEGLRKAEEWAPDIIFVDFAMPVMDGLQLTRRLRENPRTAHAKIIMITAFDDGAAKAGALRGGCDGFLKKPYEPPDLEQLLAKHVGERAPT
jgi:CheY-like chemotaxis protein